MQQRRINIVKYHPVSWCILCALLTIIGAGCSNFGALDAEMQRLVQEHTRLIGATVPPDYQPPVETPNLRDPALTEKRPATTNPQAGELSFRVADEARDVAARLEAFQRIDPTKARRLTLFEALRQAQQTGREHITAQEEYLLTAISLMIERHLWGPRFFAESQAIYANRQDDGDTTESALRLVNQLRATQRLPYGGEIEARLIWEAAEDLRNRVTGQYVQASSIAVDARIPLLRGAGLYAQEDLIQAERNLIYAAREYERFRREYLVDIARDYFDLLRQLANIANTEQQLAGFQRIETQERALYEAGRIPLLRVNNAANQVRDAEDSLANQKDNFTLQLDRFKVRLGIPVTEEVIIDTSELPIPEPDVGLDEAVQLALHYRLDLQNRRDFVEDARRRVKNASNELLPDLDLAAGVTFPTDSDAREGGLVYEPDDVQYSASARLTIPLDKKIERLNVRAATILYQRAERDLQRFRDEVVLDVRAKVRAVDLARNSLRLSTERVELTRLRKLEQEIKRDEFTTQELLDAENDLLAAENARAQAVTNLRNAVLEYLLATGQLRVARDGSLERLPGMEGGVVPPEPAVPPPDTTVPPP